MLYLWCLSSSQVVMLQGFIGFLILGCMIGQCWHLMPACLDQMSFGALPSEGFFLVPNVVTVASPHWTQTDSTKFSSPLPHSCKTYLVPSLWFQITPRNVHIDSPADLRLCDWDPVRSCLDLCDVEDIVGVCISVAHSAFVLLCSLHTLLHVPVANCVTCTCSCMCLLPIWLYLFLDDCTWPIFK